MYPLDDNEFQRVLRLYRELSLEDRKRLLAYGRMIRDNMTRPRRYPTKVPRHIADEILRRHGVERDE
jgi:succinylarginine dihydrolase